MKSSMSEAERRLMEIIWAADDPLTTKEIIANLPEGVTWKQNTVITFLARLICKGILKAGRVGKAHYYRPIVTEREYRDFETRRFIADVHKGSALGFINALCDNGDLTKEDIEKLLQRLEK